MKKFLIALTCLLATVVLANTTNMFAFGSTVKAESYQQGVVYVNYTLEGETAVKNDDLNANGVPDVVEDIATQINAVRDLFHNVYGFPDPLGSDRYKNVHTIDVDIDLRKNMGNNNGLAFRGVRKHSTHSPNEKALRIKLANIVEPRTQSTPTHEYFHLIQNGATYFHNDWFFEGMARWSQDAVAKIENYPKDKNFSSTLKEQAFEDKVFSLSYKAAQKLWYPLALSLKDKAKIPSDIVKKYRYTDGSSVFEDNVFYGPNVMKAIIATMKANEDKAAEPFGGRKQWLKNGRSSDKNNEVIWDCVKEVYGARAK